MRVCISYGIITAGGCERRMGDLCRWLLDNGDECWILASTFDALGEAVIHGQCGVPLDRVLYYNRGDGTMGAPFMQDWVRATARDFGADIIDVQWHPGYDVAPFPCKAVATVHGISSCPPQSIFSGMISVEDGIGFPDAWQHYEVIWNWVNLRRFPFREQLGDGICFVGRAFKAINARKIAQFYGGTIDGYGVSTAPQHGQPANWRWHGFADPAHVFPQYRVVFASAQTAMEAMAAGRLVIAGQTPHMPNLSDIYAEGCLVTPQNVEALARANSFSYCHGREPSAAQVWEDVQRALSCDFREERLALRAWVEARHSLETQCGRIRAFYERVANG